MRGRVPLCFRVCVRRTSSEQLRNLTRSLGIFGYYQTPTKKSWHSQDKNVMPINLTRLAGIHFAVGFSGGSTYLKGALTEGMRGHFYKYLSFGSFLKHLFLPSKFLSFAHI